MRTDGHAGRVQTRAGAQVVHLLVHRRGDGRRVASRAYDAAGEHVRTRVRVEVVDRVEAAVVGAEDGDLGAADQCGDAAFGLQPVERADRDPGHDGIPSATGWRAGTGWP